MILKTVFENAAQLSNRMVYIIPHVCLQALLSQPVRANDGRQTPSYAYLLNLHPSPNERAPRVYTASVNN